jgi:hypothetical protein
MVISQDDLRQHMTVLGKPGFGKSRLLQHIIRQLLPDRGGVGVLDPAGDLVNDVSLWIAQNIHKIEPFVANNITLFEVGKDSSFALDPLQYLDGTPGDAGHHDWLVTRSQEIAYALLRTCGQQNYHDTRRLARFLTVAIYACGVPLDRHGRHIPLPEARTLVNPLQEENQNRLSRLVYRLLPSEYKSDLDLIGRGDKDSEDLTASTLNLLRTFFDGAVSSIFSCEVQPFDFRQMLRRRGVLLVNLRKSGRLSEHQADALGFFIQSELYNAALYNGENLAPNEREPFTLVIDEAAHFVDERLGDHLRESRKFGLSYILAAQDVSSLRTNNVDLSGIVLNLPTTQITFQQQDERELDRLVPIYLYTGLKTEPLLHEEQRLKGHAFVPVIEQTERRELQEAWRKQHSLLDTQTTVAVEQHEKAAGTSQLSAKRREDGASEHDRNISLNRTIEAQSHSSEASKQANTSSIQREESAARRRNAVKDIDELATTELTREQKRSERSRSDETVALSSHSNEKSNEHANVHSKTQTDTDRRQHTSEDRDANSRAVLSGYNRRSEEHMHLEDVSSSDGSWQSRRTVDRRSGVDDLFTTTNTEKTEHARLDSRGSEQENADTFENRDTNTNRELQTSERQTKDVHGSRTIKSDSTDNDKRHRESRVIEHNNENETHDARIEETSRSKSQTDRTENRKQDEKIQLAEQGRVAERRDVQLSEEGQTTREEDKKSTGSEVKHALTDERQDASAEIKSTITAERFVTLPVNILVHQATGQWKESEDQQKAKWKRRIRKLKKRHCAVSSEHRKARVVKVPPVEDAFHEYPDEFRTALLRAFKRYLIQTSPSCFVPRLGVDADDKRREAFLLSFEQPGHLAIAGPSDQAALPRPLPVAALSAPDDCPFEI